MKYLIKAVYEIEIVVEADSKREALLKQMNDEYKYSVYAVMSESGKDIEAQYVDQMIFELQEA
jgi:hypothetical protein